MNLEKTTKKIKCDIMGCDKYADYVITYKQGFKGSGIYLCKHCINDMYMTIGKEIVPKSPINMLNTEKRKEKRYEKKK